MTVAWVECEQGLLPLQAELQRKMEYWAPNSVTMLSFKFFVCYFVSS